LKFPDVKQRDIILDELSIMINTQNSTDGDLQLYLENMIIRQSDEKNDNSLRLSETTKLNRQKSALQLVNSVSSLNSTDKNYTPVLERITKLKHLITEN